MKKIVVIADFDGTITKRDSLVEILNNFAHPAWHKIKYQINKGRLGTRIGLRKEFALCNITKDQFLNFLNKHIKIDTTFKNFLKFCRKKHLKFLVLSGGFKLNIDTVFRKYGIKNVDFYANRITFRGNSVKLIFHPKAKNCKSCSHCKAPYIKQFKKKGYYTIYIGDSVTDRCPGRVADMVFAKHHLAEYCKAKGIAYIPYNTFGQIQKYLSKNLTISR